MKILPVCQNFNNPSSKGNVKTSPAFGAKLDTNYFHQKALSWHQGMIAKTNPLDIEKYFAQFSIPATFREGTEYAKKFVSYCCCQASEIFRQMQFELPKKIDLINFKKINNNNATGCCYYLPNKADNYSIGTVLFNTFEEKIFQKIRNQNIEINWENFPLIQANSKDTNFLSSEHFLSPFIHEFAHNLHYDILYKKIGCPELYQNQYRFDPRSMDIIKKLNLPLDEKNPHVSTDVKIFIQNRISKYGAKSLTETFAEGFTQNILDNMDIWKLRLVRNPFSIGNKTINEILNEILEGAIDDKKGFIK